MMQLKNLVIILFMILSFLMSCQGERFVIKRNLVSYTGSYEKMPLRAGLYLSDKTRTYMLPVGMGINKALLGEALESEAVEALGKVFLSVSLFTDKSKAPQDIDRIITIEFGPKNDIELKIKEYFPHAVPEYVSTTELLYKVFDQKWVALTEGSSISQYTEEARSGYSAIGGAAGGFQAAQAGKYALIASVRGSLISTLEKMNGQLSSTIKNAVKQ